MISLDKTALLGSIKPSVLGQRLRQLLALGFEAGFEEVEGKGGQRGA